MAADGSFPLAPGGKRVVDMCSALKMWTYLGGALPQIKYDWIEKKRQYHQYHIGSYHLVYEFLAGCSSKFC